MLFPKSQETEIEITKIIGCNYRVNLRTLGGELISGFGDDGTSPARRSSQSSPRGAVLTSVHKLSVSRRGEGVCGDQGVLEGAPRF